MGTVRSGIESPEGAQQGAFFAWVNRREKVDNNVIIAYNVIIDNNISDDYICKELAMLKSRREERHEETIQEIKRLALRQIERSGVDELSLREISREMRVSSAALYRYFASREALLTDLIRDAFIAVNLAMVEGRDSAAAARPVERMLATCRAYRVWAKAHPAQYRLIYGSPIQGYAPDWAALLDPARGALEIILQMIEEDIRGGVIGAPEEKIHLNAELRAQMAAIVTARGYAIAPEILYTAVKGWTVLHGLVSLEIFGHLSPLILDAAALYEQEILELLQQAGYAGLSTEK